jgi:hypothetical protein
MFTIRIGAYPRVENLKEILGYAASLLSNIKLSLKGLTGANSLAYLTRLEVMKEKGFRAFSPGFHNFPVPGDFVEAGTSQK